MNQTQEQTEKKPIDYLKIVFRRKWFLVVPLVIGTIGGIVAANLLPKIYRSSTLVLVEEGRIINPLIKDLAISTSTAERLQVLREQILGWDRINQLISKLNLAKDVETQLQFEHLVKNLRKNIGVALRGNNIFSIYYEGKDPAETMNIVKTITDIFIAENLRQQSQETENAISFINDQLELYQKKVKQSEIAAMEDRLEQLMVDSTEKHPMVIELRQKIEAARGEMEEGNYQVSEESLAGGGSELTQLKEELNELREEITTASIDAEDGGINRTKYSNETNEKLYKLMLLERLEAMKDEAKNTADDAVVNQKLYNMLLERLETAKITQSLEASKEGTRYTILDPARLPLEPIKPNKLLVLLMGTFLGGCAGVGLIFAVEMLDHSFMGLDEAKAYLELPIYGAISRIVTSKDMRSEKARRARIIALSVLTAVVLITVIIFNIILSP